MPITISSPEQKILLSDEIQNVPCHEPLVVIPVIYIPFRDGSAIVTDVVCNNKNDCQFPECRFKTICEI